LINGMATIGFNLFQNLAALSAFLTFYYEWNQGIELDLSRSISTLALIFYLFVTVNQLSYLAIFQLGNFFAVLGRISSVLRLEEFNTSSKDLAVKESA